ncbi:MAG: peptidylprolyl isomerase [Bacteroidales bacterium]|nr:peptidylprolyl isomerase [Bacteroidales bacterium]
MNRIFSFTSIFVLIMIVSASSCQESKQTKVLISTDYGDITVVLFDETPLHRDNFIKLVNEGWYDGSIFHRVISNFMIQGGGHADGRPDPEYTVPAEIVDIYFHKKGVLSAARKPDHVNPNKESSGSQFYIVQGQVFTDEQLDSFEQRFGKDFPEERREVYRTLGGTPHLDGDYTVFGEVISGLDVVDKIAAVQTAKGDKPVKDVKMTIKIVK